SLGLVVGAYLRRGSGELPPMRRSDALGRGCEDGKGSAAFDGEARPCPAPTARRTSDPARSAESSVRQLNGALAEADLPFEMFEGVDWCIFLGARASVEGSSTSDRARWCSRFASRHLQRHSRPGAPCSQRAVLASSIALCPARQRRPPVLRKPAHGHVGPGEDCDDVDDDACTNTCETTA